MNTIYFLGYGTLNKDDIIFKGTKIGSWDLSGLNSISPNLCPPRTSEYVLIRNRVFEDIIKVRHERRSFWMRAASNPMSVLAENRRGQRQREESHVKPATEIRVMQLQAKGSIKEQTCVVTKFMVLGGPKSSFRFFHTILQKNPNELFRQPNTLLWQP